MTTMKWIMAALAAMMLVSGMAQARVQEEAIEKCETETNGNSYSKSCVGQRDGCVGTWSESGFIDKNGEATPVYYRNTTACI
jgi:hypothetical protein